MKKKIVLVGGGGHCKSCIDLIEKERSYGIKGILDNNLQIGTAILNYKIIGNDDSIPVYAGDCDFLLTIGQILSPDLRIKLFNIIKDAGGNHAQIISPTAMVSRYSSIGEGTIIMHAAVVNADASIGSNCIVNTLANVEHDVVIGDHCHISTGVMINGGAKIGQRCFIGSGAVIANNISIADNVVIGAGSCVTRSIASSGVFAGNPARFLKNI